MGHKPYSGIDLTGSVIIESWNISAERASYYRIISRSAWLLNIEGQQLINMKCSISPTVDYTASKRSRHDLKQLISSTCFNINSLIAAREWKVPNPVDRLKLKTFPCSQVTLNWITYDKGKVVQIREQWDSAGESFVFISSYTKGEIKKQERKVNGRESAHDMWKLCSRVKLGENQFKLFQCALIWLHSQPEKACSWVSSIFVISVD